MPDFFSVLALEAEELAKGLLLTTRQRYWKTEKIWQYRNYQHGDPAQMIDWRQSARSEKLLIREAEPMQFRPLLLWMPTTQQDIPQGRRAALLLTALGYMLIKAERKVGWLSEELRQTRTFPIFRNILADALDLSPTCAAPPEVPALRFAALILAGAFAEAPPEWLQVIHAHGVRGNKGVLLDFSKTDSSAIHDCAKNMGWPVIRTSPNEAPEPALLHLFEESLKGSV